MDAARRHGPLKMTRLPDLGGEQRALYLALKHEAARPTVRLRYRTLGVVVALAFVAGGVLGFSLR